MSKFRGTPHPALRLVAAALFVAFALTAGGPSADTTAPFAVDLTSPAPPDTTGLPMTITANNQYAWDAFAWQSFVAMNWPAITPTEDNGWLRGWPSRAAGETFDNAGAAEMLVWETFKEKREVFYYGVDTMSEADPSPWSADFNYGSQPSADDGGDHPKRLTANAKQTPPADTVDTLDETVEVKGEALESYYADIKFRNHTPTVARVFRGTQPDLGGYGGGNPSPGNAVRYEVKVNYDFFDYVVDNGLYFDATRSAKLPAQLPWRTSASGTSTSHHEFGYDMNTWATEKYVASPPKGANPPLIGSVHIKAAWAPIEESESQYFVAREAEYFVSTDPSDPSTKTYETGLYGLVGLHIIQRIKVDPDKPLGGAFIFSTWEHRGIDDPTDPTQPSYPGPTTQYSYTNYFLNPVTYQFSEPIPNVFGTGAEAPFYVNRLYPILPHTVRANEMFWSQLSPDSIWHNYRLVGTQFMPHNITTDGPIMGNGQAGKNPPQPNTTTNPNTGGEPGVGDQPYYLSNLVIETNLGLQQFQGQPPSFFPAVNFKTKVDPNTSVSDFVRTGTSSKFGNISYGGTTYSTGGCMGCHGVAQLQGFSFSFVLLAGQAGADPDSELDFLAPLTAPTTSSN